MVQGLIAAWVAVAVVAYAAYSLSARSAQQKFNQTATLPDEKPTARSTRGSFLPLLIGRDRLAPIIAWCGDRTTKQKIVATPGAGGGGGKGGGGGGGTPAPVTITQYFESALHLLCIGPAFRLNRIYADGKVIFDGPIDSNSHPSGSDVDLGEEGKFEIYWGEYNQPISSYLGEADRVGVESRWPYHCFLIWRPKFLGTGGYHWPSIEYDVEARVAETFLASSASWINSELIETDKTFDIVDAADGDDGEGYVAVSGKHKKAFKTSGFVKIAGCGSLADDVYDVERVHYDKNLDRTFVYLSDEIEGVSGSGTATSVEKVQVSGVNQAHALAQILFAEFPHGRGLPMRDFEMASLEAFGEAVSDTHEGLPASIRARDGADIEESVSAIMADCGVMVSLAPEGGYRFKLVRAPGADRLIVPREAILPTRPEVEINHGDRPAERAIYYWNDRKHKFRVFTNTIDADGAATVTGFAKARRIELATIIDADTAKKVSERRSQEELGNGSHVRVFAGRALRRAFAGQYLEVEGVPFGLRLLEVTIDPLSSKVTLDAVSDFYGLPLSDVETTEDDNNGGGDPFEAEENLMTAVMQVPTERAWDGTIHGDATIVVMQVRGDEHVVTSDVYLSKNGTTYRPIGNSATFALGGTLLDALPANQEGYVDEGPTATYVGPDLGQVIDLTGDDDHWHAGIQLCVIEYVRVDGETDWEICYLRGVDVIDATTLRLRGLLRARIGTGYQHHDVGARFFIFPHAGMYRLSHRFLKPGNTVYVKAVPHTAGDGLPVGDVDPVVHKVTHEGVLQSAPGRPYLVTVLGSGTNTWTTSANLIFAWPYRSIETPNTASGQQDAGVVSEAADPVGKFKFQLYHVDVDANPGATPKIVVDNLEAPTTTVTQATLNSTFPGGIPTDLWVRVLNKKKEIKGEFSPTVRIRKSTAFSSL